ncbi:MAG: DUF5103 domain-containing protein [Chitinophagales bacterium]|nr:DUF5103 domain-containing protein [Chitinophagales bacterium]
MKTYNDTVSQTWIKTVQLQRADLVLVAPVILLNSDDKLILKFDDLRGGTQDYSYTFMHCGQHWEQSNLTFFDFLEGFEENTVSDYAFSFATLQAYTHYKIEFPNDDVSFKVSGNYIIQVWEEGNDTLPVITKRFYVWEDIVDVQGNVSRPNLIPYRTEYQEVNFTVDIKNTDVTNPYDEIRVTLKQNNRDDNAYTNLKPRLISNDLIFYDDDNTVFYGGKEFRRFDMRSLRFQTDRIRKIERGDHRYDIYVTVDESRSYQQYYYETDINGNYIVMADLTNDTDLEADYAYVHFALLYPYYQSGGEFHVVGEMNDYHCNQDNKMVYNFDRQMYEVVLYLKQGYYNYLYIFMDKFKPFFDLSYAEGNYFETENGYSVFIYQHVYDRDYDRLIGVQQFNSIKK